MELTLLRHAAPRTEYHGRYIGHTDIGIDPSLFDAAKAAPVAAVRYERIYCSDLLRCTATLHEMGIKECTIDPRLREVRFKSDIEGATFADIEKRGDFDPKFLDSMEGWHRYICDETRGFFRSRIQSFLDELPSEGDILICTHAGVIAMIHAILRPKLPPPHCGYQDHTRLTLPIG